MQEEQRTVRRERPKAIQLTDAAATRVQELIIKRDKKALGIRIGVRQGGCSGLSYTFEYCDEKAPHDEMVEDKGVTVFIDPKAIMYLIGTTMDYVDEKVKSGFVFINPNEKAKCGCGSSFTV